MEEAYRAALACIPGMNILALPRLIEMAGGPTTLWNIFENGGGRAAALVGSEKAAQFKEASRSSHPGMVLKELKRHGIRVMFPGGPDFPERLTSIYDPPAVLFMKGNQLPHQGMYVAVVGARRASGYGKWVAETLAAQLAGLGIVVVSGAAYGVDACAHLGCLKASGFTAAVLGCGIDRIYPAEHEKLFQNIENSGCIVSEYPPGAEPLAWHFPHRNRIIAGLSHAVVVVEAAEKSGALITADMALEEGREVLAVPGPINSFLSLGTNALIQKGAKLVRSIEDICDELPWDFSH
ncbi:MAG: DNA protecting protein DprA, partial [Actinobacteria bacterium RBG_19FT_COMBO_54_7]